MAMTGQETLKADWMLRAKADPHAFLNFMLAGDICLEPWVLEPYCIAAAADPTAATRLVQNYAALPKAKEVLMAAFRALPSAAETYPQWRAILPATDVEEIESALLITRFSNALPHRTQSSPLLP